MIPATHKRRPVYLTLIVVTMLALALLCKPPLIAGATANTVDISGTSVSSAADIDIVSTITSLLKCYMGSCGMESQTP